MTEAPVGAVSDTSDDSSLDDALPAVGKVHEGPRRSLAEIIAADSRQRAAASLQALPAVIGSDLAGIWSTFIEQVRTKVGPSAYTSMISGEPRRNGSQFTIHFSGAFAAMAKILGKYREPMQRVLSEVMGEAMLLQFEADENAPTRPQATPSSRPEQQPAAGQPSRAQSAPADGRTGSREGIPLTPELRDQLEKDPLIRAVMEAFNGSIVKVEQSESPKNV